MHNPDASPEKTNAIAFRILEE